MQVIVDGGPCDTPASALASALAALRRQRALGAPGPAGTPPAGRPYADADAGSQYEAGHGGFGDGPLVGLGPELLIEWEVIIVTVSVQIIGARVTRSVPAVRQPRPRVRFGPRADRRGLQDLQDRAAAEARLIPPPQTYILM